MTQTRVVVTGLRELNKALKAADQEAADAMKAAMKLIAEGVAGDVRGRVPRLTGKAAASYKPRGGVKGAAIAFGGSKAPYAPWLDFGGAVGRRKSVRRPVVSGGRYLYPAIADNMSDVQEKVAKAISDITGQYGFRVEGS